jgi:nucleotide-binding universal stress UspA family protein
MSSTDTIPVAAALLDDERTTIGPIVVATDGTEFSEPALESARLLAQDTGGTVYVVAIHEIMPPHIYEMAALSAIREAEEGQREALRRQVESQVHRIAGEQFPAWTIIVRDGDPATELSRTSAELGARALVIGVRHRHLADRLFGRETALRLLHQCRVPLLIVPAGFAHLPRRVVVAIDFSAASLHAARTAFSLFETISEVSLMHVTPSPVPTPQLYGSWREWLDEDMTRGFAWAQAELALAPGIKVKTVSKGGHAAREIVSVARDEGVDLIVTGTRGAGLFQRLLSGSTARGVVHGADCAVLVVRPPASLNVSYPLLEPEREPIPRKQWAAALARFTGLNAGRRATIEVDDPSCGAQVQVTDYALLGVDYDVRSDQVEIMVGDFTSTQPHLTRNISDVRSIHILPDTTGRDWILRVAHGRGQTVLTLHR